MKNVSRRVGVVGALEVAHSEADEVRCEGVELTSQDLERIRFKAEINEPCRVGIADVGHDREKTDGKGRVGELFTVSRYEGDVHAGFFLCDWSVSRCGSSRRRVPISNGTPRIQGLGDIPRD